MDAILEGYMATVCRFVAVKPGSDHPALDAAPSSIVDSTAVSPEDLVADRARGRELRQALSELTPEQEEILTLKYVLGYENQQIAAITGRTVGAVKALQHRRLATLESRLAGGRAAWS
jgi:RNA polymerase sigma-70 factor (ECF subfamily)